VKLTTNLQLVPRSKTLIPNTPSWCGTLLSTRKTLLYLCLEKFGYIF